MRILLTKENKRFYIHNKHLFYYDHNCMMHLGEKVDPNYCISPDVQQYETGVLVIKRVGYDKVSDVAFFDNNGSRIFHLNTDQQPFDVNLYKSKADNINCIVFDNGILVSMKNKDNQSKFAFYFYDKSFLTGYKFNDLIEKVKKISQTNEYTDMILNMLDGKEMQ